MALTWAGSPEARLAESVRASAESWALLIDGEIEALFGLVRYPLDVSVFLRVRLSPCSRALLFIKFNRP
ncbi:hypothetical protein [Burkholderia cepacia]|uniref:hypothetical protein n=1 Tax=Burkholderia cepacia TaxID=292 RepID=UPI002ABDA227|nr:hypothetical protein [Burkholderia cepacia]